MGIAASLKNRIVAGELKVGQYVPGVRELGREHGVSPETARRAMKIMEAEHWVRCYPGHGFKITAMGNDPAAAAPVAFILSGREEADGWSPFGQHLLAAMYRAAESRGWSLLGIGAGGRRRGDVVAEIASARVAGLLLDTADEKLAAELTRLGVPTVLVEELCPGLDSVTQDNFGGGLRAAEYLAGRGHRRLGWFGHLSSTVPSRERWAGAHAALRDADAEIVVQGRLGRDSGESDEDRAVLRRALRGRRKITGILTPWWTGAVTAAKLAREEGLEPGRDLEFVAWCPREQLGEFRAAWPAGDLPATAVWSINDLGDAALGRLAERRERPTAPPVRVSMGVELVPAEQLAKERGAA
jgi:LacI family transcriptional regulator